MTTALPRRGRHWAWFFLVLLLLGGTAVTIEVWYNLRQQLTPAQLAVARQTWEQNRPRNYDFTYNVSRQTQAPAEDILAEQDPVRAPLQNLGTRTPEPATDLTHEYRVRVRDGKTLEVRCNGKVMWGDDLEAYSMEGLYAALARQLELDSEPGQPRVFAVGTFGKGDRRLLRYVRSCRARRERVEVKFVELTPRD